MKQNLTIPQSILTMLSVSKSATELSAKLDSIRVDGVSAATALWSGLGSLAVDTVADAFTASGITDQNEALSNAYQSWLLSSARPDEVERITLDKLVQVEATVKALLRQRSDMDTILSGKGGFAAKLGQLAIKAGLKTKRVKTDPSVDSECKATAKTLVNTTNMLGTAFVQGDYEAVLAAEEHILRNEALVAQQRRLLDAAKLAVKADIPAVPGEFLTTETTETISA